MSRVMDTTCTLTGESRVVATFWGPRIEVLKRVQEWDTNTGHDEPDRFVWERATNTDILRLNAMPKDVKPGQHLIVATFWGPRIKVALATPRIFETLPHLSNNHPTWKNATNSDMLRAKQSA